MKHFGLRLEESMREHGAVCVGIDPHPQLLDSWGLRDDVAGLRAFSLGVVEALGGRVGAFKPQAAFFERFGSQGVAVLEEVIDACRSVGSLCIVDAKRGDIGSTMNGYAEAYVGEHSPLGADAVTLSPYLGVGSLRPAYELARENGKGFFILALTSNPEGRSVQHARDVAGVSVAGEIVSQVARLNQESDKDNIGSFGVVVGATVGSAVRDLGIDLAALNGPILAPGIGAQGADPAQVRDIFRGAEKQVLASSSRAILQAGPDIEKLNKAYEQTVKSLKFLR